MNILTNKRRISEGVAKEYNLVLPSNYEQSLYYTQSVNLNFAYVLCWLYNSIPMSSNEIWEKLRKDYDYTQSVRQYQRIIKLYSPKFELGKTRGQKESFRLAMKKERIKWVIEPKNEKRLININKQAKMASGRCA